MIRVAVVDDEALTRAALRQILESAGDIEVVAECEGRHATNRVRATAPDLALVDAVMPDIDGLTVIRALLALDSPPATAMLTAFDDGSRFRDALHSGAAGFLVKDSDPDMLIAAVRVLAAGGSVLKPTVQHTFADTLRPHEAPMPFRATTTPARLTPRERDVLCLVAVGMSNAETAAVLGIGLATVKYHVHSLRAKLGAKTRVALAVAAHNMGLNAETRELCRQS
ncbi:DNA-binding response regulator [Streptomyces spiroverticillatus]|uniref:DNA-binding response regulator n=1 Tax=Streptomyces finlayi TaxID=67296 RepID=A0A919CEF9_9ACTN|nr:response regulator transcription factor [Streptomyces finlayi]GHA36057.1 DNA-binding response regulator [Streptomyces spiroverticillatus]GHD12470.1 DNA-binding response regulator [Streptomyces finlayi]